MKGHGARWLEATVSEGPGHALTSDRRYRLAFEHGALPPVYDLWSVTLYDARTGGNAIERYSRSLWGNGLAYEADGSLNLGLEHEPPTRARSHWIPTPREPFRVVVRLYDPCDLLLDGTYVLPPIELSAWDPPGTRPFQTPIEIGQRATGTESAVPPPVELVGFQLRP
ncbi:MAG: DUF1214 domain-containing protein [Myxococcota bacterium]|nr:DUF1214 domain-containing protein [Myxococcota bacterium]